MRCKTEVCFSDLEPSYGHWSGMVSTLARLVRFRTVPRDPGRRRSTVEFRNNAQEPVFMWRNSNPRARFVLRTVGNWTVGNWGTACVAGVGTDAGP